MLSKIESNKILALLKKEVVPAMGCTEPMAVALATAKATELLGETPDMVIAHISANIIKNAMGVGIPGSEGMVGLPAAIALAALAGKSEYSLEVLKDVNHEDVERAKAFIESRKFMVIQARDTQEILYVEIEARKDEKKSKVIIARNHTNFVYLQSPKAILLDNRDMLNNAVASEHETSLTMAKVYEFATTVPLANLRFILDSATMNKSVSQLAFSGDYGLNLGKSLLGGDFEQRMLGYTTMPKIVIYTCAACDVRMSGAQVPVMTNSGSGNQGIAATIPVVVFAEDTQATESKLIRALTLSHLTVIYIKQLLGRLSAHCGCVIAATGSACGITYLMGGDYNHVCYAIKNQIAALTGMVCDGAKPSCSLKISSAVSSAFQAALLSMDNICVSSNDGIIEQDVDKSIRNLADIGRDAMHEVDNIVLKIMVNKDNPSCE